MKALDERWKQQQACFRIQDLCDRLNVPYRDARYICEKAWLPDGVEREPGRGNHRRLTAAQAVWLGIVLKLKASGVQTAMAAKITAFACRIQDYSCNAGWDWRFAPFSGAFATEHQWYVEVGDMQFVRFVTDAYPSQPGLYQTPWVHMDSRREARQAQPIVCIRVDVSALARLLHSLS